MSVRLSSALRTIVFLLAGLIGHAADCSAAEGVVVPNFWDQRRRIDKPDSTQIRQIRFLTEDDYPPFHFAGPGGAPAGFEIDLARAICEQLKATCLIQARRWDSLADSLDQNRGDAIIAAMKISAESRARFAFTASYFRFPARFTVRKDSDLATISADGLKGRKVAVAAGSAHEAYLRAFFPAAVPVTVKDGAAVLEAVRSGETQAGFADGVTAAFWLNGEVSKDCCRFAGGPYTESRYFGEGAGIAVKRDNPKLQQALDWALHRLASEGVYSTLYLKYFPISIY